MRKVTAAVMASTLAFSAFSRAAVAIISDNGSSAEGATQHSSQSHMFDGISLTEHQRQQMRDLMQRARHDQPLLMLAKWRQCIALSPQKILTKALYALRPKKWRRNRLPAVEMAKVRNQMFHLLTPEQQAVLNTKHQQRMNQLREVARMQRSSDMTLFSSNSSTRSNQ